jgi:hypothetical protein
VAVEHGRGGVDAARRRRGSSVLCCAPSTGMQ